MHLLALDASVVILSFQGNASVRAVNASVRAVNASVRAVNASVRELSMSMPHWKLLCVCFSG
jgi:hypothetical protein